MSYRIRFTLPDGRTGLWAHEYQTREAAQAAIDDRLADTGFAYAVEEVASPEPEPEPTSTTERLVGLLRGRHARGLSKYGTTLDRGDLTPEQWAHHAIEEALDLAGYLMRLKDGFGQEPGSTAAHDVEILRRDLAFAIQIGDALRNAMRTGEWRAGHDRSMANSAVAGWDRWKASLAASLQGTAKASEAPREGGDSGRRRLEALERWLKGKYCDSIIWQGNAFGAFSKIVEIVAIEAPTLAALADKLAEKEDKP